MVYPSTYRASMVACASSTNTKLEKNLGDTQKKFKRNMERVQSWRNISKGKRASSKWG